MGILATHAKQTVQHEAEITVSNDLMVRKSGFVGAFSRNPILVGPVKLTGPCYILAGGKEFALF